MDKKSKEALRRYKKARLAARQRSSSESSSSSSDSDSYSSCSGNSRKKNRQSSSSGDRMDERRKREKREHCQKKLEAKRNHLKRKLKEAKLKKRAAVAAAVLSGHSHRALSPNTQAKLKKLAERKHLRAQSKERREREREKHRAAAREREREHRRSEHSRSPTKITKIRIHQDVKRQKSPPRMHQMLSREKIIIQARTRSHTPSAERERMRHEQKLRHEDLAIARERERRERERERAEREAARDKERAEALARCQERQRERERIAREKLRREEEDKKYGGERGERLIPRAGELELGMGSSRVYNSRERSMDSERGRHLSKRELDAVYEREREYLEVERRGLLDREELRREREYMAGRRRDLSPGADPYAARIRDPRDIYEDERVYGRPYLDEARHPREREAGWLPRDLHEREIREPRDFRDMEHDMRYAEERERELLMRERTLAARGDWKTTWADSPGRSGERNWDDGGAPHATRSGFVGGPKRGGASGSAKLPATREQRANSEPDWDAGETMEGAKKGESTRDGSGVQRDPWVEHDHRELPREKPLAVGRQAEHLDRRWPADWRDGEDGRLVAEAGLGHLHHHRSERGGRGGFRRGLEHGFRGPPPLMTLPVQPPGTYGGNPRFPNKRNMTYTNPNLIKKQQAIAAAKAAAQASAVAAATTAVAAAKAAAQSAANATTNPSILGQVTSKNNTADDKPEAGEILPEHEESEAAVEAAAAAAAATATATAAAAPAGTAEVNAETSTSPAAKPSIATEETKASGELSEISDSEDDILNKAERKSKSEMEDAGSEAVVKAETAPAPEKAEEAINTELERTTEEDEMLDFEEISDGELEEEARHKGVGDALGVDWASLIAETKSQAENAAQPNAEQPTTAKQKWQPHRIILDIGISLRMAGEDYAKRLIADAQQKLQDEVAQLTVVKTEIKEEIVAAPDDDDSQATTAPLDTDAENTTNSETEKKFDVNKVTIKSGEEINMEPTALNVERLHPLACIQVAQRKRLLEQRQLFANACGPNSRALSARQDLKLRRQLCGLPAVEPNLPIPIPKVSDKLKAMALAAFKRTMEVK